eukprot:TRINITY_DN4529_c0_g1_i1.p1 TRINITY_DN4529_c0_g1~~TRINITY_DN4529_c0_g1_i1.p1  ORF type:complete len:391 (+),score=35.05 TRINITY_DN4529_c0_g1_i1:74-1246(+)
MGQKQTKIKSGSKSNITFSNRIKSNSISTSPSVVSPPSYSSQPDLNTNLPKCNGCQGFGVGLVQANGWCLHCNSKRSMSSDDVEIKRTDNLQPFVPPNNSYTPAQPSLCHYFANGYCRNGTACQFRHEASTTVVLCPICGTSLTGQDSVKIDQHVDGCLGNRAALYASGGANTTTQTCAQCSMYTTVNSAGLCKECEATRLLSYANLRNTGSNPFTVTCPYPSCSSQHDAKDFPWHVNTTHSVESFQRYSCPVCQLISGETYAVNDQTNLLQHIRTIHSDMLTPPVQQPIVNGFENDFPDFVYDPTSFETTTTTTTTSNTENIPIPTVLGSAFVVSTADSSLSGKECIICFEDFNEGDTIARLECFCVFHHTCIDSWFKKSGNKCPLHKD